MKRRLEEEQYRHDALLFNEAQQNIGMGGVRDYFSAANAPQHNIIAQQSQTRNGVVDFPFPLPLQPPGALHPSMIRTGYMHAGKHEALKRYKVN